MPPPRVRPGTAPPPEAFGELPGSFAVAEPDEVRESRSAVSYSQRKVGGRPAPTAPPPPEAWGEEQSLLHRSSRDASRVASRGSAAGGGKLGSSPGASGAEDADDGDGDDDGSDDEGSAEGKEERAESRAKAEAESKAKAEAEAAARRLQESERRRAKLPGIAPPPRPPPQPVVLQENLIPRGRMEIELVRVVGVGALGAVPGGGHGSGLDATVFIQLEMILGANQRRVRARTPHWRHLDSLDDFEPPEDADGGFLLLPLTEAVPAPNPAADLPERERALLPPLLAYQIFSVQRAGFLGGASEELVAEGVVPAAQLFSETLKTQRGLMRDGKDSSRWLGEDFTLPLKAPSARSKAKARGAGSADAEDEAGRQITALTSAGVFAHIAVRIKFVLSRCGTLVVVPHEAKNLANMRTLMGGARDVQVVTWVGKASDGAGAAGALPLAKGTVFKGAGENPYLGDEELMLWIDHATAATALPLKIELREGARVIGTHTARLGPMLRSFEPMDASCELRAPDNRAPDQTLLLTHRFYPAGELVFKVVKGINLATRAGVGGTVDVFFMIDVPSVVRPFKARTALCSGGNIDPIWNEIFVIDVIDHAQIKLTLIEKGTLFGDEVLGEVTIDLENVFRFGIRDGPIPVKKKATWGGYEDVGMVELETDFTGPPGLSYPMLNPLSKSYNDSERKRRKGATAAEREAIQLRAKAAEDMKREQELAEERRAAGGDFSDREIQDAFDFLDLDHNLVVGASELRHVLTCMGELVTAEEIDKMIELCDYDGDGQVSFYEFYQMARAANPGEKSWAPLPEHEYRTKEPGLLAGAPRPPPVIVYDSFGKPVPIDAGDDAEARKKAVARAAEVARKAEKRRICEELVQRLKLRLPELQFCYKALKRTPAFKKGGHCTYEEMLHVLGVNEDGTNARADEDEDDGDEGKGKGGKGGPALPKRSNFRDVFSVFSSLDESSGKNTGLVNMRELLLALNNFTGATKPQKVNFCFFLFDEDGSGEISLNELTQVLQAAHLASRVDPALKAKAANIMAQADKDGSGTISLEEFVVLAQRFPNLVLPDFDQRDGSGNVIDGSNVIGK